MAMRRLIGAVLIASLGAAIAGCAAVAKEDAVSVRATALEELSTVVQRLIVAVGGDWSQRVPASTGPCSSGGTGNGLEWADDWDGVGVEVATAIAVGERILSEAGFETEQQPGPYGSAVHGRSADGGSILLDVGHNGEALLDARSACFPESED